MQMPKLFVTVVQGDRLTDNNVCLCYARLFGTCIFVVISVLSSYLIIEYWIKEREKCLTILLKKGAAKLYAYKPHMINLIRGN